MTSKHRYCNGTGQVRLASGADGHCFGCNGTGVRTPATAEQREARANWHRAYSAMQSMPRTFTIEGIGPARFRSGVLAGLETLAEREPVRLPALYVAVAEGRLADVAVALYRYAEGV